MYVFLPAVKRCSNDALSTIFGFSLTHDNFEKDACPVGSTVNIHCPDTQLEGKYVRNKRIVKDEWDGGKFSQRRARKTKLWNQVNQKIFSSNFIF